MRPALLRVLLPLSLFLSILCSALAVPYTFDYTVQGVLIDEDKAEPHGFEAVVSYDSTNSFCLYHIRFERALPFVPFTEIGCDGTNCYVLAHVSDTELVPVATRGVMPQAAVMPNLPGLIWLGYASGPYIQEQVLKTGKAYPLFSDLSAKVNGVLPNPDEPVKTSSTIDAVHRVVRLDYLHLMEGKEVRDARYEVLDWFNDNPVPKKYRVTWWHHGPSSLRSAEGRASSYLVMATNITHRVQGISFLPIFFGHTNIQVRDRRFRMAGVGYDFDIYYKTNRWLSLAEVMQLPEYLQTMRGAKAVIEADDVRRRRRAILMIAFFLLLLSPGIFLALSRKKMETQKLNTSE